jgi:hypothetical protein
MLFTHFLGTGEHQRLQFETELLINIKRIMFFTFQNPIDTPKEKPLIVILEYKLLVLVANLFVFVF